MTGSNEHPTMDRLDQAVQALRQTPIPQGPSPEVVASTVEALKKMSEPEIFRLQQRRKIMIRIARYGSAAMAAAVLLALSVSLFLMNWSAPLAFGQLVENVKKAKSVSFIVKTPHAVQGRTGVILQQKFYIQDEAYRMEILSAHEGADIAIPADAPPVLMAIIADAKQKKGLQLDFVRKSAWIMDVDDKRWEKMSHGVGNLIEELRKLKNEDAESLGEETLDGRKTPVYRLKKLDVMELRLEKGDTAKLWADPKSGLPVRIRVESVGDDGKVKNFMIFEQFTWNEPLPAELFSVEVPKGFTEAQEPMFK